METSNENLDSDAGTERVNQGVMYDKHDWTKKEKEKLESMTILYFIDFK